MLAGARGLVLAFLLILAPAGAFAAAPKFPALTGRVVDGANMLSPQAEQRLTDAFAQLEAKTGRQVVVATVPDLQGLEVEDYGYQLGRAWGIGRAGKNDGAILLVAPKERRVRLEVGYGLEPVLTDALSSVIINREILPAFKAGQMEAGVVAGGEAIVRQLELPDADARAQVAAAAEPKVTIARDNARGGGGVPIFVVIFILFWVLSGILRVFGGRRRFGGGGGGLWWQLPMILSSGGRGGGGGGWSGGGGGFTGGGGSFGGGGASGRW